MKRKSFIMLFIGVAALAVAAACIITARKPAPVGGTIGDPLSIAVFVDKAESLSSEYVPPDLTQCRVNAVKSWATQKSIYNAVKNANGEEYTNLYVALPGHSEHQTGLAMDITNIDHNDDDHDKRLGTMPEGIWLAENAHRFGFILRYPEGKTDITGYSYEPWHFRYVGVNMSAEIYDKGITLDEYMQSQGE